MNLKIKLGIALLLAVCNVVLISCHKELVETLYTEEEKSYPIYRPIPQKQLTGGDPEKGFEYLIYGDYMGTGIPYESFVNLVNKPLKRLVGDDEGKVLNREGINADIPFSHTAFNSQTGAKVVNGNCFSCHASQFEGEVVLGMGNSFSDYRRSFKLPMLAMNTLLRIKYNNESPEWLAYEPTLPIIKALSNKTASPNIGMNPAARTAEVSGLLRNPVDLTVVEEPLDTFEMAPINIATDVPPLWHVKKKHVLYYNGLGRGDFTKLLMQITLAGITDTTHAREVQEKFVDVLAWINEIEPPTYPHPIDQTLASKGKTIFNDKCSKCHGTYGEREQYPNKIVPLHEIQTDPAYARATMMSHFVDWYNQSWYATSTPTSSVKPSEGYIATPLDGVWATAPYLHNGSVPTLADLLESKRRPLYWQRSGNPEDYNYDLVGWNYVRKQNGGGKWTYDTTEKGSNNVGHYYGDTLTSSDRVAVIEYLKTL